jgi:hypothetical protein
VSEVKRYALIGTGHRATMFVRALTTAHKDAGQLVALADTNAHRAGVHAANITAAGLPAVAIYDAADAHRMLDEVRPDRLIVTSPDYTHAGYVVAALDRGIDVISEKPLTIDAAGLRAICDALDRSTADLTVTFNYRYSPRNAAVKRLITEGAIGKVLSVHFEWLLDTAHGADYFRRWHRHKESSGGLLVHKSTHHFDLVNWWLADRPASVYALGGLRFYGAQNAIDRGLAPAPALSRDADPAAEPFRLDMAADPHLRQLYIEAEHLDGYHRDRNVFDAGITAEDTLSLVVGYRNGASMSYALTAFSPWEGYRVGINGTGGRIELEVVERSWVPAPGGGDAFIVDPSALADGHGAGTELRPEGERLILQQLWQPAREIEIPKGVGGHGGGDGAMLADIFRGAAADSLGRAAGYIDGVRSVIVGVAGNRSLETGQAVDVAAFGLPLGATSRG